MTGQVFLDVAGLQAAAMSISNAVSAVKMRWTPCVPGSVSWLNRTLQHAGVANVTCPTLPVALSMANAGFDDVVVLEQPATNDRAQAMAELNRQVRALSCIDHFYHAELLSRAASRLKVMIGVLIEVDVGRHWSGIRPGFDAQRLALATSRLPGLTVYGLIGRDPNQTDVCPSHDDPDDTRAVLVQEIAGTLRHTQALVQRDLSQDIQIRWISGGALAELKLMSGITEIGTSHFPGEGVIERPLATIKADVLSRPSLQQAVLTGGTRLFGTASSSVRMVDPGTARVERMDQETCVVSLSGRSLDLAIGDTVQLQANFSLSQLLQLDSAGILVPVTENSLSSTGVTSRIADNSEH